MPTARRLALVLSALTLSSTFAFPGARAEPPDCDAYDDGATVHPIPMTGNTGTCRAFLLEELNDLVQLSWDVHREWNLTITLTFEVPVLVEVARRENGAFFERQTGVGPFLFTADLSPWPNYSDLPIVELYQVRLTAGGASWFTITVQRDPIVDSDCGGPDTTTASPYMLTWGLACAARFVDGWRTGYIWEQPNRPHDAFKVTGLTDADLVQLDLSMNGHTYGVDGRDATGYVFLRDVSPSSTRIDLIKEGSSDLSIDVSPIYPDVIGHWECGKFGCEFVIERIEDEDSTAPFTYSIRARVTPNDRPTIYVTQPPPAYVFDGGSLSFEMAVEDPDLDTVRPVVSIDPSAPVTLTPASGPSSTPFTVQMGPILGAELRYIRVGAADALGAAAVAGAATYRVDVHPADCVAGTGDAPAAGRLFSGTCNGWLHPTRDASDVLLFDATGGSRVTLLPTGANATVTSPSGETLVVPMGGAYVDHTSLGGRYRIDLAADARYTSGQSYALVAYAAPVASPGANVTATIRSTFRVSDSDQTAETNSGWLRTHADYVSQTFDVPALALAAATGARLRVLGQGADCSGTNSIVTVNSGAGNFAQCSVWSTSSLSWGTIAIPTSWLRAGTNSFTLRPNWDANADHFRLAIDTAFATDRVDLRVGSAAVPGRLVWALELDLPAANSDGSYTRGRNVSIEVVADDVKARDATVTVDWRDGSPLETFPAAWRVPTSRLHRYETAGSYAPRVTAVAAATYSTTASALVRLPNDCGALGDAPPEGRSFTGSCRGYLAPDDATDVLVLSSGPGQHVRIAASGAAVTITAPDGSNPTLLDGVAHDWTGTGGNYTLRLDAWPNLTADAAYDVAATLVNASAPSGEAALSLPPVWPVRASIPATLSASDLDYEDVALTIDWGDGSAPQRVPATGLVGSGAVQSASHTYASAGAYTVAVAAVNRLGTPLASVMRPVSVLAGGDCGAGEAPNALDGNAPTLGDAPCWGLLNASDTRDHYSVLVDATQSFAVDLCPNEPLRASASLFAMVPHQTGVAGAPLTSAVALGNGCTRLAPNRDAALTTQYVVRVERTSGEGTYTLALRRGASLLPPLAPTQDAFNAQYTFDGSDEGWRREYDALWSDAAWDAVSGRIALSADRRDARDESFARPFPSDLTPLAASVNVSATWRATTQGNSQYAFPLVLAPAGAVDFGAGIGVVAVTYASRDANVGQAPLYAFRYRDLTGALRIDQTFVGAEGASYRFEVAYAATTQTLAMRAFAANGTLVASASYLVGSAPNDGFQLGKVAVATDGRSGSREPAAVAYVDDIAVAVSGAA